MKYINYYSINKTDTEGDLKIAVAFSREIKIIADFTVAHSLYVQLSGVSL